MYKGLFFLLCLSLYASAAYVSPEIQQEITANHSARVIVVLKQPSLGQQSDIQARPLESFKASIVPSLKLQRRFSSFDGFSANVTSDELQALQTHPLVESVFLDQPVHAFTQRSIPQINADKVQNYLIKGANVTGRGQTVCVVDTGVDYYHESLGACENPFLTVLERYSQRFVLNSPHPYNNTPDVVTFPGGAILSPNVTTFLINSSQLGLGRFGRIAVHFANLSIASYDSLYVLDSQDRIIASYYGNKTNFWTPSVPGHVLKLQIVAVSGFFNISPAYGFTTDRISNGSLANQTRSFVLESAHPYRNATNTTFIVNTSALSFGRFERTAVHFERLSVESDFDYILIEDPQGRVVANYTSSKTDLWSPSVAGDTIVIRLVSDFAFNDYGFRIDLINNGTTEGDRKIQCGRFLGGYDVVNRDDDPLDDENHGTHVSGIAAGNGLIRGVAPGANIVAVKVLDQFGSGFTSDVITGIDWCTQNRQAYNISVISMSLGGFELFSNYCDNQPEAAAVQRAYDAGLFVSVASGNSYSSRSISSPACLRHSTAVGAVNSFDSIAYFSNTWKNFLLLAPGVEINSSLRDQTTGNASGTSMAAPHVSGTVALLQEAALLSNGTRVSPAYLRDVLHRSGVLVSDFRSELAFPRVDALAALKALLSDVSPRQIALLSFANGSANKETYSFINISSVDDDPLSSCLLEWNNGTKTNYTMAISGRSCSFNVSSQTGEFRANFTVFLKDSFGNAASAFFSRAFDPVPPRVVVNFINNSLIFSSTLYVNASFTETNPDSCVFQLDGITFSSAARASSCALSVGVSEGRHSLRVSVNDTAGNVNQSDIYFFTVVLGTPANLTFLNPTPLNGSFLNRNTTSFNLSFFDNDPSACTLSLNGTNHSMTLFAGLGPAFYCILTMTNLSDGVYTMQVFVNDTASLTNASETRSFVIDATAPLLGGFTGGFPVNSTRQFTVSAWASDNISAYLNLTLTLSNSSGVVFYKPSSRRVVEDEGIPNKTNIRYDFVISNLSLAEGNYSVNITAEDNATNRAFLAPGSIAVDLTPPLASSLYVLNSPSGFVFLNWSAGVDAVAFCCFKLFRNSSEIFFKDQNATDRDVVYGSTYVYRLVAYDKAGNSNFTQTQLLFVNDSIAPRQVANLTVQNLPDGSVNISWSPTVFDVTGGLERNITYFVYRGSNASAVRTSGFSSQNVNVTGLTLLANATNTSYVDSSALSANALYVYSVLAGDANLNINATLSTTNTMNHTTVAACTNDFSAWSACTGGVQTRSRTCLGATETQTQSCTLPASPIAGGSSGSSSSGGVGGGAQIFSGSSGSTPTGGGGGGGSGQLFVIYQLPKTLELNPEEPATTSFVFSSYYTGFLRYVNITVKGIPPTWYRTSNVTLLSPLTNTTLSIDWRIPEHAQGTYPVILEVSGVGTKTAGILRASYDFEIVLPSSSKPAKPSRTASSATVPSEEPVSSPQGPPLQQSPASQTGLVVAFPAGFSVLDVGLIVVMVLVIGYFVFSETTRRRPRV